MVLIFLSQNTYESPSFVTYERCRKKGYNNTLYFPKKCSLFVWQMALKHSAGLDGAKEGQGLCYLQSHWSTVIPEQHFCISLVSIATIKTIIKSNLGKRGLIWLTHPEKWSSRKGLTRTQGRNWNRNHQVTLLLQTCFSWLARPALLYYPWPLDHRWNYSQSAGYTPPPLLIKQMAQSLAYRPVWWRHFLSWGSFFSDNSSLC